MISDNLSDNRVFGPCGHRENPLFARGGGLAERLTQRIANPCLETRIPINKTRQNRVVSKSDNRPERFGNVPGMLTTAMMEQDA